MKISLTLSGGILSLIGFYWYRYVVNNGDIFEVAHPDFFMRPKFLPMIIILVGVIILISGIVKEGKKEKEKIEFV